MKVRLNDTIAAIATPPGEGAIAVIRLSGPGAILIADRIFRGTSPLTAAVGYTVHFGTVQEHDGEPIDQVLATLFRSPHSYTGEDQVEISCHGGQFITGRILNALVASGARHAEPGEFTRRAFVNGKMDLAQAEAVADMIRARSEKMRQASYEQLQGKLGDKVRTLRSALTDLCSLLEMDLDFSEEGLGVISRDDVGRRLLALDQELEGMLSSFEQGKLAREGVEVVLVGKPNAGKSSIFNALLREERAIVDPLPGTTRDSLEENLTISGMLFRVHDTAGLRETKDLVETEGVRRSQVIMNRADILLDVIDATTPVDREEVAGWRKGIGTSQYCIALFNKIDLVDQKERTNLVSEPESILVSARTGEGLEELRKRLLAVVQEKALEPASIGITNTRHAESLAKARQSLMFAVDALKKGSTSEFIAFDAREAANHLAEITGEITSEEILNSIFAKFCIGK